MACSSSRTYPEASDLSERTRAVHRVTSQRSVLPPAPTSSQLLSLLHEAAKLQAQPSAPDLATQDNNEGSAALGNPSPSSGSSAYAEYIRRHCPTSRRVHSSFAAAGAHSALGEMLQFFAVSLTHLFADGVESVAALSFPSEWDRRLSDPNAAPLRENYLYELQGFSALFTYVWGNIAAMQPSLQRPREKKGEDKEDDRRAYRSAAAPPASSPTPPPAFVAPKDVSERRILKVKRTAPAGAAATAGAAAPVPAARVLPLPQLGTKLDPANKTSSIVRFTTPHTYAAGPNTFSQSTGATLSHSVHGRQSQPLTGLELALGEASVPTQLVTVPAKGRGRFLPSLPLEGLVPHSQLPHMGKEVRGEGTPQRGRALPTVPSGPGTSSSAKDAEAPHLSPSARQRAIAQAMEQDHAREVRRTLGVRQVRNFAKEEDMQEYLHTFQQNMLSVLDEGAEDTGGGGGGDGREDGRRL